MSLACPVSARTVRTSAITPVEDFFCFPFTEKGQKFNPKATKGRAENLLFCDHPTYKLDNFEKIISE